MQTAERISLTPFMHILKTGLIYIIFRPFFVLLEEVEIGSRRRGRGEKDDFFLIEDFFANVVVLSFV